MAEVSKIKNVQRLLAKLRAKAAQARKDTDVSVSVGYTQSYAIYVHENMEAQHKDGKQAKYLTGPMKQHKKEIADVIKNSLKHKKTMAQSLLLGGLLLQRLSQQVVPIDTGALKNSAFTRLNER
jgi:hypothetical protein